MPTIPIHKDWVYLVAVQLDFPSAPIAEAHGRPRSSRSNYEDMGRRGEGGSYRGRREYQNNRGNHQPYYGRDRRRGGDNRSSRYGVRRETLLNGSYSDYVREFTRQGPPPMPMPGYGPPPPGYGHMEPPPPYPGHYNRRDYSHPGYRNSPRSHGSRSRPDDHRRSYEQDVDEFLRRNAGRDRRAEAPYRSERR